MAYQNINKIVISSFLFTVKKNLNTIFFRGWNLLICSWAMWMIRLWFEQIVRKKTRDKLENFVFFVCFWQFVPFLCPRANRCSRSSLICSFLKSKLSDFLPPLYTVQKSDGSNLLFFTSESLFCSQKTSESLEKPMSELSTLIFTNTLCPWNILMWFLEPFYKIT